MLGPAHILAVGLLMAGTSGCTLLDLLLGTPPSFDPDEPFPFPTTEATFSTGRATIQIGGDAIVLDELVGEAGVSPDLGTHVAWENDDGWYLSFTALPGEVPFSAGSYLSIDRIADNEHWVLADPSRCVTTTETVAATGVNGSATCRGLQWADFFSAYSGTGFPKPIPSQAAFDAEITFEAH
jgi:hypothetical protein